MSDLGSPWRFIIDLPKNVLIFLLWNKAQKKTLIESTNHSKLMLIEKKTKKKTQLKKVGWKNCLRNAIYTERIIKRLRERKVEKKKSYRTKTTILFFSRLNRDRIQQQQQKHTRDHKIFYDSASGGFNAPVTHSILVSLYIVHIYIQHSYCLRRDTKERGVQERAVYVYHDETQIKRK